MNIALNNIAVIAAISTLIGAPLVMGVEPSATSQPVQNSVPAPVTSSVVQAANAFLATLDEKQRSTVLFKFDDNEQRARWSNFPTGFVPRGGLRMKDLNDTQRASVMALLTTVLSDRGMEKVQQIRDADDVFKTQAGSHRPHGGPGGGPRDGGPGGGGPGGPPPFDRDGRGPTSGPTSRPMRDDHNFGGPGGPRGNRPPFGGGGPRGGDGEMFGKDLYFISILGTPSENEPWMLQFGGHHLALNITIVGEHGVLTPTLTGAQPSLYTVDGKTVRPIGPENDKAFALLNSLDDSQHKQAILSYQVSDLVLGPGHDGEIIQPEGVKASGMNESQRTLLLSLIAEWVGIVNDSYAAPRMAEIEAGLDDTYFAWSGPTTCEPGKNGSAYYRIQGPKLVIEFAPQHDDPTMHVHTMYRDPTDDYGQAYTAIRK